MWIYLTDFLLLISLAHVVFVRLFPHLLCHVHTLTATFRSTIKHFNLSNISVCLFVCLFVCGTLQELMRQNTERANMI